MLHLLLNLIILPQCSGIKKRFDPILQIDASSLISASVMAAPCALAISKLSYPETEESPFKSEKNVKVSAGWVHLPLPVLTCLS